MIGMQEKDALNSERETPLMMCHDTFNQVHNSKIIKLQVSRQFRALPCFPALFSKNGRFHFMVTPRADVHSS